MYESYGLKMIVNSKIKNFTLCIKYIKISILKTVFLSKTLIAS